MFHRVVAAAEAWELIVFCGLLHLSVKSVMSIEEEDTSTMKKGIFRVSGVYHEAI